MALAMPTPHSSAQGRPCQLIVALFAEGPTAITVFSRAVDSPSSHSKLAFDIEPTCLFQLKGCWLYAIWKTVCDCYFFPQLLQREIQFYFLSWKYSFTSGCWQRVKIITSNNTGLDVHTGLGIHSLIFQVHTFCICL